MNKSKILELAKEHDVKLVRRHWFDRRDDNGKRETHFIDLPRPLADVRDELVAKGVLS